MKLLERLVQYLVFALCIGFGLSGCGNKSVDRFAVSGTVKVDGKPLDSGFITFSPIGKGVSAGGKVESGNYSIPQAQGPSQGKYRVEINSPKPTGKMIAGRDPNAKVPELKESIAPKFNAKSDLIADIEPGKTKHDFDAATVKEEKAEKKADKKK